MVGYVYVLSNPSHPSLVKIGFTCRPVDERARELSSATGVPAPFEVEYYCLTKDVEQVESEVHASLSSSRVPNREFFAVQVAVAVGVIDSLVRGVEPERFCRVSLSGTPPSKQNANSDEPFFVLGLDRERVRTLRPATTAQVETLSHLINGGNPRSKVVELPKNLTAGEADKLIDELKRRRDKGLATYKQTAALRRNGINPDGVTFQRANAIMEHLRAGRQVPMELLTKDGE